MLAREGAIRAAAMVLTIAVLAIGVLYSVFAISVTSARINELVSIEAKMRDKAAEIARVPHASNVDTPLQELR
jgi:hypothetical protein